MRLRSASILASVFVVATCGLVHELLAATLASYVLGNSVRQYALVIGLYLSAMGVGALASRRVSTGLARWFVGIELALALVGGLSVPALHLLFGHLASFGPALYSVVFAIGVMVGTELPLLMRLLDDDLSFRELVSRSLLADHIGSLAAALLFPLALVPYVGLLRTGVLVGLCNAAVALWGAWFLRDSLGRASTPLRVAGVLVALTLAAAWRWSPLIESHAERAMDAVGLDGVCPHPRCRAPLPPRQCLGGGAPDAGSIAGAFQFMSAPPPRHCLGGRGARQRGWGHTPSRLTALLCATTSPGSRS